MSLLPGDLQNEFVLLGNQVKSLSLGNEYLLFRLGDQTGVHVQHILPCVLLFTASFPKGWFWPRQAVLEGCHRGFLTHFLSNFCCLISCLLSTTTQQ